MRKKKPFRKKTPCSDVDVEPVRDQAQRMIKEASERIKRGKFSHCALQLESAKTAVAAAGKIRGELAQRDAYVRATFHAGQAQACAYDPGDPGKKVARTRARYSAKAGKAAS